MRIRTFVAIVDQGDGSASPYFFKTREAYEQWKADEKEAGYETITLQDYEENILEEGEFEVVG